jgi:hypothetical protein
MLRIFTDWRVTVFGLLSWAVPFLVSFPFFDPRTGLLVPLELFKSIMVVVGTSSGVALLVWLFRRITPAPVSGLIIGLYWMVLNWVLDLIFLLPMSGTGIGVYAYDIGLRYLVFPVIACGMGAAAAIRTKN